MEYWYAVNDSLFAHRNDDGSIRLAFADKRPDYGGVIVAETQIDDGHWGSFVLVMSVFGERPNDWRAFMDHHHGRKDILAAPKAMATCKSIAERLTEVTK